MQLIAHARALARRLARDERGVSAVEFAFVLPIMVLLYLGMAEITLSMMAERRAAHAASAVGDLIAQNRTANITKDDIDKIFFVGLASMRPYGTATLSMRVTSVQADKDKVPKVVWSKSRGPSLGKLGKDATVTPFPAGLLDVGESVVMSEIEYNYSNPLMKIIPHPVTFKDTYYLRPRRTQVINCPDCP